MDSPLPPDQISELLNDALPPGYKLIRARCGCGHLHNIISGKPLPTSLGAGQSQHRMSYKLLQKHHTEINQQNEELRQQLIDLRDRVHKMDHEKTQLYDAVKEYEERNEFLQDQIKQLLVLKDEFEQLTTENDMIKSEASKGHVLVQQWKERCDELTLEKDSALTQVKQYREKIEELMQNEKMQEEQRHIKSSSMHEENKLLKQKCDNLQTQYESMKQQFDDTIKQQNDELNSLMSEVRLSSIGAPTGTKGGIGRMTTTSPGYIRLNSSSFNSSSGINSKQRSKLWKKLREEIVSLKQRNVALAKQIMSVTKDNQNNVQQHEMELRQAREEIESLRTDLSNTEKKNAAYAVLSKEHEKVCAQLKSTQDELASLKEEHKTAKKTTLTQQSSINRLQNDNKVLREQRDRLQNRESKARLHDRNDQKHLLQEIEQLKKRIRVQASEFQTLKHQMEADYRARLKEMREQKEYLENRVQILKQKVEILQCSEKKLRLKLKDSWREAGKLSRASNLSTSGARDSIYLGLEQQENSAPNNIPVVTPNKRTRMAKRGNPRRFSSVSHTTSAPITPSKKLSNRRKEKMIEKQRADAVTADSNGETSLSHSISQETEPTHSTQSPVTQDNSVEDSLENNTTEDNTAGDKMESSSGGLSDTTPVPRKEEPTPSATS